MQKALARNYAKAFLEIAKEHNALPDAVQRARQLAGVFFQKEHIHFFVNPSIAKHMRRQVVEDVIQRAVKEQWMQDFFWYVFDKNHFALLPYMVQEWDELLPGYVNVVHVSIQSAMKLSSAARQRICSWVEKRFNKQVVLLDCQIEPALIGGVTVRVEDSIFDSSLKGRLFGLSRRLIGGEFVYGKT